MSEYEFTVTMSRSLYEAKGTGNFLGKVKEYIEHAFDSSPHTAFVKVYAPAASDLPDPPIENYVSECLETDSDDDCVRRRKHYDTLCGEQRAYTWMNDWFRDWVQCESPSYMQADDCHILLTNESGGGVTADDNGETYIVAEAKHVDEAPDTYQRYNTGRGHGDMQTIIHEIGHQMLEFDPEADEKRERDYDFPHGGHTTGEVTKTNDSIWSQSYHFVTPLGMNGPEKTTNFCNESFDRPGERRWDLQLASDCGQDRWVDPGEN
ncbi:hypothetical protein [Natrinema pallidum]|uniref:Uncharacterized protein n=1 Tax=Natrinema pallidum DSM 3751 TaxID=1227495 RepID=L9YIS1_9EURY|nr:hypothetical protein [Natrinema pallidum]ELY73999.1 hypothetical protein C487_16309 [Natrinema pallidum DSM 3751]